MLKFNRQTIAFKTSAVMLSKVISAAIALLFVPVYIRLLGVESYGLVAFYLLLSNVLVLIDFALSTALSRQVVILKAKKESDTAIKDLVFSVEMIYGFLSMLIFLVIYIFAEKISLHWLKVNELPVEKVKLSVRYIGLLIALQFPSSIYNGVMIAMEKQVLNSVITIIINILKAIGVIYVLHIFSSTIENYFIWQIIITLCSVIVLRYFTWKNFSVSKGVRAKFSKEQINPIKAFGIGMFGVTFVNFLLSMTDKLVVSKTVALDLVACYSLAFQVASIMGQIIGPLQSTLFPKFTQLVTHNNTLESTSLYHRSCKWVAIFIWPIGLGLTFFAKDIIWLWTKNEFVTTHTSPVLQLVAIGTLCNCLMFVPYIFMLSKGKTKFTIIQNSISAVILLPVLFWSIPKYGILGASFLWLGINFSYIIISIPIFHKLYMKNELKKWYIQDNLYPFLISLCFMVFAKLCRVYISAFESNALFVTLICLITLIYVYLTPELRNLADKFYKLLKIEKK